ncbi:multidrug and toxin extrusion protein 2-like [Pelodytes ibericus]
MSNGNRQGCPLSPLLYILSFEPLAIRIRNNKNIKGFPSKDAAFKISLYVDDIVITVTSPQVSLGHLMDEIGQYSIASNYKLNVDKARVLSLNVPDSLVAELRVHFPFDWTNKQIECLGLVIVSEVDQIVETNFMRLYRQTNRLLKEWRQWEASWWGRINILKAYIVPKWNYLFRMIPLSVPESWLDMAQRRFTAYAWKAKKPRISVKLLSKKFNKGGLNFPSIRHLYQANMMVHLYHLQGKILPSLRISLVDQLLGNISLQRWFGGIDVRVEDLLHEHKLLDFSDFADRTMNRQEGKIIGKQQPKESSPLKGKSTWLPLFLHRLLPVEEMKLLILLAGPMFLSEFFIYIVDVVSSIFAGHLGKIELDSVSLAVSIINVTGTSVGLGLSNGCNTLMSQTYGGKNMKRVGTILQRGILILLLFCFPCWAIFINTENILLLVRQDPIVARCTGAYVMICIPALPAMFVFQLQVQYLQNQSIIWPQVFTGIIANIINVLLNAIFLYGVNWGTVGSAWANTISRILMCFMLFVYIRVKKVHVDSWAGWSSDCFQEWGTFMRLAIPSMFLMCAQLWTFEAGGLLSGLISEVELGAHSIILQLSTIAYLLPLGFSAAASVRVGNALGAGDINQAKLASKASLLCTGGFAVLMCTLLLGLNKQFPYMFTSDKEIISLVSLLILMYAPFHIFDALKCTCGGILQGSGKQKIGAIIGGVGNYILGLPVGIALMFAAKLGIVGFWIGMIVSSFIKVFFIMTFVIRLNWSKICNEAQVLAGLKSKEMGPDADIIHQGRANAGFGLVENGDLPSSATRQFVEDHNITRGIILPEISSGGKYTDELVQKEDSGIETTNVVGEILSVKQLILWRGLALVLAVTTLIIGVTIRLTSVHEVEESILLTLVDPSIEDLPSISGAHPRSEFKPD